MDSHNTWIRFWGAGQASFAINTYTLTYNAGAHGSIDGTSPQMVSYGTGGTAATAVPDTGYHFVEWSDHSTVNPRTDANVTADITVTASFAINTYTLTYNAGAHGSIDGTSPQTVNYGADGAAVTAVPGTGYHFVEWSDHSTANPRTDTNVTADVTVTAGLEADPLDELAPDLHVTIECESGSGPTDTDCGTVDVGEEASFLVTVQNLGTGDASDVTIVVPIPEGMEYVSATVVVASTAQAAPDQVLVVDDTVYISVRTVAPNEQVQVEVVLRARVSGQVVVAAGAASDEKPGVVPAASPARVTAADEYYVIEQVLLPTCGALGAAPMLACLLALCFMRCGMGGIRRTGPARRPDK